MTNYKITTRIQIALITLTMHLFGVGEVFARTEKTTDSIQSESHKNIARKSVINVIGEQFNNVTEFFMGCDTTYITPQLYNLTAQVEAIYWHDYYRLASTSNQSRMVIQSKHPLILGAHICWSIFGYGHYINIDDIGSSGSESYGTSQRNSFTVNTAKLAAELYTFKSGKSAEITKLTDFSLKGKDNSFSGLKSNCFGFNAEYIFNHKKYSWPAAFGMNAVQRKSVGSWKLGISYNHQRISFDKMKLPSHIMEIPIDTTLLFSNIDYKDYAISIGYGYNWVFKKNCLFAISLQPSVGYRRSNIKSNDDNRSILKNISTDLITKASLFWNNTKYFSGLILEMHTYSYREKEFGLTNSYGTLKYVLGFNFWKKK